MHRSYLLLALSTLAASISTSQSCLDDDGSNLLDLISCGPSPSIIDRCLQSTSNQPASAFVYCLVQSGCRSVDDRSLQAVFARCDGEGYTIKHQDMASTERDTTLRRRGYGRRIMQRQDFGDTAAATSDFNPFSTQDQASASATLGSSLTESSQSDLTESSQSDNAGTTTITQGAQSTSSSTSTTSSRRTATTITITPTLSSTSSSSSSKTSSAASSTSTPDPSKGGHITVAGIIVGAILGFVVLCAIVFVCFLNIRRARRSRQERKRESISYQALLVPDEAKREHSMYSRTDLAASFLGQEQDPESRSQRYPREGQRDIPLEAVQTTRPTSSERGHRTRHSHSRSISGGLYPMENPYDPYGSHEALSNPSHSRSRPGSSQSSSPLSVRSHRSASNTIPAVPAINFSTPHPHPRHTRSSSSVSSQGLQRQYSFDGAGQDDRDPISRESSRSSFHPNALASNPPAPSRPVPRLHIRTPSSGVQMVPTILTPGSPPF